MLDDFGDFGEECIYNSWNPNHNTFTSACGNACRCKSSTILTSVLGNLEQKETIAVISFLGQLESHIHRSYIGYNICWKMLKTVQEKNHVLNGFTSLTGLVEWKTHLYAYMRRRILLLGHFGLCQPSPMDFLFTKLHSFTYHHHTCREFSLQGVEDIYIYIQRLYDVWTIYWLGCSNHAPSKPIYLYLPILPYIYMYILRFPASKLFRDPSFAMSKKYLYMYINIRSSFGHPPTLIFVKAVRLVPCFLIDWRSAISNHSRRSGFWYSSLVCWSTWHFPFGLTSTKRRSLILNASWPSTSAIYIFHDSWIPRPHCKGREVRSICIKQKTCLSLLAHDWQKKS